MTRAGCLGGLVTNLRFQEEGNRMPRRSILSAAERESLLALPDTKDELIRHYTFSESDLSIIRQRRGPANRLGFAVQLCYLRFPGVILGADEPPFPPLLRLGDTKLYIPKGDATYEALKPMIGGTLNIKHVRAHWDEILRMATSIKQGTATASLMLRKLGSYPRQNGLAVALRELGRIERTLFILDWLQSVELRRRVHAGLNKGEARNALARAVFFNRLGEIRDRSFEQQRYRASGLNLVTAAIVLWNTVYLERAANALRGHGQAVDDGLLQYLSPLGWEHINLTGDYLWRSSAKIGAGKFRPLRPLQPA
ncbi:MULTISPECIES: Tn3 family transposase [Brachymonas]|uniref:Tn3 family transposase n=1 Tax=Brachymonas TaxID=28219 RepID=UPI002E7687C6|nr:Tn3 family transposase [Brachymonas sp. J145]MEE1653250.1 Tn3 family transposase [Brachymonas sp. J145]